MDVLRPLRSAAKGSLPRGMKGPGDENKRRKVGLRPRADLAQGDGLVRAIAYVASAQNRSMAKKSIDDHEEKSRTHRHCKP